MKLYACIISPDAKRDRDALLSVAQKFSYNVELLEDGVLFDVSGLQNLVGDRAKISQTILDALEENSIPGGIAVAETTDAAILLARNPKSKSSPPAGGGVAEALRSRGGGSNPKSHTEFSQLPVKDLPIDEDTLNVFRDLGIKSIRDLREVPKDELINRYGQKFKHIIDVIEQTGGRLLTPNVKENKVDWNYQLDFPVDDFEQLVFILNHGLDRLLSETDRYGFSTEQLDILFALDNKTERAYEIKTSFPTLDKTFWLKLINLRISLDPPESEIVGINATSHFTPPRPAQRGLYAVSRPDPEKLLLTVNKLKKLVGEDQVGIPALLDQRVEKPFALNAEAIPEGKENAEFTGRNRSSSEGVDLPAMTPSLPVGFPPANPALQPPPAAQTSVIAFSYFNPPIPAEVLVRDKKLIFLRTQYFNGRVAKYSGVWKANSKWWDEAWKAEEWDVEIEDNGVYRLCRVGKDWFLVGEYD